MAIVAAALNATSEMISFFMGLSSSDARAYPASLQLIRAIMKRA